MTESEIKKAVAEQIIGMITNDVINKCGTESFVGWVEDGDAFYLNGMENEEDLAKAMELVHELNDAVTGIVARLGN